MTDEPRLIDGGLAVDDRGSVSFVNAFAFDEVKRCYTVRNHAAGFVRAWHGHRHEGKFVMPVGGAALVCCVAIDDWEHPAPDAFVHRFVLSVDKPAVLEIPAGFANGFMSLTEDAALMFFSTSTVEDSMNDDYRFDSRLWDPWKVEER
jgi:dTDP-4-dehydrorhamnose 3,5-epimerase